MGLPYKSHGEFYDRYMNSVIYLKGKPIFISDVNPRPTDRRDSYEYKKGDLTSLSYMTVPYTDRSKVHHIDAMDENLSDIPIHVGYCNAFTKENKRGEFLINAEYLSRMPVRRFKQGLSSENLHVPLNQPLRFNNLLYKQEFADMLQREYDSHKKVIETIKANSIVAFHPKFAVERDVFDRIILHFRGSVVGHSDSGGDRYKLLKTSEFLREVIEEDLKLKVA